MFGRSGLTYFVSFLALLGPTLAANLYRKDERTPAEIHAAGGIVSWDPHGTGSVTDHAKAKLRHEDPWVSTTSSRTFARSGAQSPGSVYVYYIDPSGLKPVSVAKAFEKIKEPDPHPAEKEFSIRGEIPWDNIVKWETWTRSKLAATTTREEFEAGGSSPKKAGSPSPKKGSTSSPKKGATKKPTARSFVA